MLQDKFKEILHTPFLWKGNLNGLKQFEIENPVFKVYPEQSHPNNLRLGKQIESFVEFQLKNVPNLTLLQSNLQIINNKRTLGEMDFLFKLNNEPVHLEVVYKFYLYNPLVGSSELDHWIGPNNKDCLVYKLEKLKNKQLPLLFKPETQPYLDEFNLSAHTIQQMVYFKAQLFTPYQSNKTDYKYINEACIQGFYITIDQLHDFKQYGFFLPRKHDWISPILLDLEWLDYSAFNTQIELCKQNKQAPLCWLKSPEGKLSKCFVYFEKEF